ncbi:type II toxin-antitoxin system VapC family toxin [Myceligenerans crystallogenes]|uniref:Ribonuclease VapC n=1 Tax=Myceligenerans crystallogenes TaxID=316335 RepID=A0ABP4ZFG5_9MICO
MVVVIADTSGLIASIDQDAPEHEGARKVLNQASVVVVPQLVLAELDHLVSRRFGKTLAARLLDSLIAQAERTRVHFAEADAAVLRTARAVQDQHADLRLDLTDAVITAVAREYMTASILTLDRKDFRAIRPLTGEPAFQVLPDDDW